MRHLTLALAVALGVAGTVSAQDTMMPEHKTVSPDQIAWGPAPPGLPAGSKAAVLIGNPAAAGSFTLRAWLPKGYKVPPHWHATEENLTILSGTLRVGMGDSLDAAKATPLSAGGFAALPANMHHYVIADSDVVLQVHGTGPFAITYINPADDPRNAMTQSR